MLKRTHRLNQINEFIRQKFGKIVNQEMELPEGALVTVTAVKTSPDLHYARIGISIYPDSQTDTVFAAICRNLRKLKYLLHQELTFKFAPDIKVYIDTTAQEAFKMEKLLDSLGKRQKMQANTVFLL